MLGCAGPEVDDLGKLGTEVLYSVSRDGRKEGDKEM